MGDIHIYRASDQPATRWVDNHTDREIVFTLKPNRLVWCYNCNRRRPAKNCIVHSYYDATYFFCATGKGCKSEREIKAKRSREYRNRSRGQKRRWAAV